MTQNDPLRLYIYIYIIQALPLNLDDASTSQVQDPKYKNLSLSSNTIKMSSKSSTDNLLESSTPESSTVTNNGTTAKLHEVPLIEERVPLLQKTAEVTGDATIPKSVKTCDWSKDAIIRGDPFLRSILGMFQDQHPSSLRGISENCPNKGEALKEFIEGRDLDTLKDKDIEETTPAICEEFQKLDQSKRTDNITEIPIFDEGKIIKKQKVDITLYNEGNDTDPIEVRYNYFALHS